MTPQPPAPLPLPDPEAEWGNNIALSPSALKRAGQSTLSLTEHPQLWVNRRVDTIKFIDEHLARHRLSIDFRLPEELPTVVKSEHGEVHFVPVTILHRRSGLERVDVCDEAGTALPILNRFETARISGVALEEAAGRVLGERPSEDVLRLVFGVATAAPGRSPDPGLVRALIDPRSSEFFDLRIKESRAARKALAGERKFCDLVALFAIGSVVIVPLSDSVGRRKIVKLAWDEEVVEGRLFGEDSRLRGPRTQRLASALGFWGKVAVMDMSLVGGAEAHHLQIEMPGEVEMTVAELKAVEPLERLKPDVEARFPVTTPVYRKTQPDPRRRAHIYLDNTPRLAMGTMRAELRGAHGSFLRGALAAAFLIAAMLWLYFIRADSIAKQTSSASVLLLAPGLLAAYIVRPGEHLMARSLRRATRWLLAIDGILVLVAAAAFVAFAPGPNAKHPEVPKALTIIWLVCAISATAILALLLVPWLRSWAKSRKKEPGAEAD